MPAVSLLFVRIGLNLRFSSEIILDLKIGRLRFRLLPKKNEKINIKKYTKKAIEKRARNEKRKKLKQEQKEQREKEKRAEKQKKASLIPKTAKEKRQEKFRSITQTVKLITHLISYVLGRFFGYLRADINTLKITVASDDAAKTAVLYGTAAQGVCYLYNYLSDHFDIRLKHPENAGVYVDFVSDKIKADIDLTFSVTLWQAAALLFKTLFEFIKYSTKQKNQS